MMKMEHKRMLNLPPEKLWLFVAAASLIAAAGSAVMAALSFADENLIVMILSIISAAIFAACFVMAWKIWLRIREINAPPAHIECLQLKKPGIERDHEEVIVPKGKMPDR